jgi:phosphate transport system substrate-binding protein
MFGWLAGCTVDRRADDSGGPGGSKSGASEAINVDGSSTVAPISMAIAEVYEDQHPDVVLKVERSGTGGGFDKFARGEAHICNASRPIKPSEAEACRRNGVTYTEVMVATDGLTVAVHADNDWCTALTIDQLAKLWAKDSQVQNWSDLDPDWPAESIDLFGADSKSGTYDYFKEETVGAEVPMRTDYQPNSDDNVLVEGIAGNPYALGFFGFSYYIENRDKLKAVAIAPRGQGASAAVPPSVETVASGAYTPLARPLFIYVNNGELQRSIVREFVEFHLSDEGQKLIADKGFIALNPQQLAAAREKFQQAVASQSP